MTLDLVPGSFWRFPTVRSMWDEDTDFPVTHTPSGLSISEDDKHVYVEAAIPGVAPEDVEITYDKGVLWIKGEAKQEETKKTFYRKAMNQFSYRVMVPGDIDDDVEPEASAKNGIMTVAFAKSPKTQPKKIKVK